MDGERSWKAETPGPRRRAGWRSAVGALLALSVTATLVVLPASPALATHDDVCPAYTSETHAVEDEIVAEAVVIPLQLAHDIAEATSDMMGERAKHSATILDAIPFLIAEALANATAIAFSKAAWAAKVAVLGLKTTNKIADECRTGAHWTLLDELLKSAIRRDLAVTTTPVALFVLPTSAGGYIDGGEAADSGGVGVKVIVRETIDKMIALGQCTCSSANSSYNQAVTELTAGRYKSAYRLFRQAYVYAFSN